MKIYTKRGDMGKTDIRGKRIFKNDLILEVVGTIDELNSIIGELLLYTSPKNTEFLEKIQHWLFSLNACIAFPQKKFPFSTFTIKIEEEIDKLAKNISPLHEFILPNGPIATIKSHIARTVCRRAERCLCALARKIHVNPDMIPLMNRLSDYLFILARKQAVGFAEKKWKRYNTAA